MHLQFLGCGDAFGSGGRLNTCFHVVGEEINFLIDCGASSMPALQRAGVDRQAIDTILITHFHGDHFGGVPFFILEAQMISKRTRPLRIVGPPKLAERYAQAMDVAFPSSKHIPERFKLEFVEIEPGETKAFGRLQVKALEVLHTPAAGPCLGYRIEAEGKIIAYSGDTEWTDNLIQLGREADLFVCECYTHERKVSHHTSLATLESHLEEIRPKRLILTHMSSDMLERIATVPYEAAYDGMVVTI